MRVSGKQVAEHRAALVATARRLLQKHGFDGAGVAEISREAGLTQGALYGQFKSKSDLAREATSSAFAGTADYWRTLRESTPDPLRAYIDGYLSEEHITDPGSGCLMAACVSDLPRQDPSICATFTDGFRELADLIAAALPEGTPPEAARRRALTLVAGMVGSVAMARAMDKTDPDLAREILAAARMELERLAVVPLPPK